MKLPDKIDHGGYFVLDEPPGEQHRVARIGRQLAAGADQKHVHHIAQAGKFALIVQDDGLNARTLGDQPEQPGLATSRIRLDQKPGIDQRGQATFEPSTVDNLPQ